MTIVSIDPSLRSTGIYINEDGEEHSMTWVNKKGGRIAFLGSLLEKVAPLVNIADYLLIEGYSFGSIGRSVTTQAEIGGAIRALFANAHVPIIEIPIQTWKKQTGIRMSKKTFSDKIAYLDAVEAKYKKRLVTCDEADAYLMFKCFMSMVYTDNKEEKK